MKPQVLLGGILLLVGVSILVFQGIFTATTSVGGTNPATPEEKSRDVVPGVPILGAVSMAGGIFLVVLGSRKPAA